MLKKLTKEEFAQLKASIRKVEDRGKIKPADNTIRKLRRQQVD